MPKNTKKFFYSVIAFFSFMLIACDGAEPKTPPTTTLVSDADAGMLSDAGPSDSGNAFFDAGSLDAGLFDAGSPPLSIEEQAEMLCLGLLKGQANRSLSSIELADRCSAQDEIPDLLLQPNLVNIDASRCLPGRADHQVFLTALQAGRVAVDMNAFTTCLQEAQALRRQYATINVTETRSLQLKAHLESETCRKIFTPQQAENEECTQAWDCQPGLFCQANPRSSSSYLCLPKATEGSACYENAAPTNLPLRICDDDTACFNQVCTRRLELGDFCDASTVACAQNLICGPAGFCALKGEIGAPCAVATHCADGLICSNSLCIEPQVQATLIADGASCFLGDSCAGNCSVCRPETPGGADAYCQDRGGLGDACSSLDHCRADTFCAVEGICAAYRTIAESCDAVSQCESGLYCNPDFALCQKLPILGNPCSVEGPNVCGEGFCTFGTCLAGVNTDLCINDSQCAAGFICSQIQIDTDAGTSFENQCIFAPRIGAPCSREGRCTASAFCDVTGRCRAYPEAGDSCPAGICQSGSFCVNAGTEAALCERQRPAAALCQNNGQCRSNICLDEGLCAGTSPSTLTRPEIYLFFLGFAMLPFFRRSRARKRA